MNDRLIIKKAIHTFAKTGDLLLDEVEVGLLNSAAPHGSVDVMVVSCIQSIPPISFFNVQHHTFYHCASASLKTLSTFKSDASGKLILYHSK